MKIFGLVGVGVIVPIVLAIIACVLQHPAVFNI